jgi:hypothetical protein
MHPLVEAVENVRQKIGCDAFTGIRYADFHLCAGPFEQHLDLSVLGSELDSVVQEVPEDLLQAVRIAGNRPGKGIQQRPKANTFCPRRREPRDSVRPRATRRVPDSRCFHP